MPRKSEKKLATIKKKRKVTLPVSFKSYYPNVYDGKLQITSASVKIMDSFMSDMFEKIVEEAALLCRIGKRKTLTKRDIETATKLVLNVGEVARGAIIHANRAVWKLKKSYQESTSQDTILTSNALPTSEESLSHSTSLSYTFASSSTSSQASQKSTDYSMFATNVRETYRSSPRASSESSSASFKTPPEEDL